MTREIKFRAWALSANGEDHYMLSPEQTMVDMLLHSNDEFTKIMQYTGLKDKNGVEIYEGDIVSGVLYKDYTEHIGRIIYDFNGYRIVTKEKSLMLDLTEKLQVIGNIYQNPELLEQRNVRPETE